VRLLILLALTAVLVGTVFYLAHRLHRWIRHFAPKLSPTIPLTVLTALLVLMVLSIFRPFDGTVQRIISGIGTFWMGIFAYLTMFFILADGVEWLLRLCRCLSRPAVDRFRLVAGITATALALCVPAYGLIHAKQIQVVSYDVQLSQDTSSELNIVLISDVHLGAVGSEARLEQMVEKINGLSPDLVCIAGDFFDNDFDAVSDPEKALSLLRQLRAPYGVYACLGNHDAGASFDQMEAFLAAANIRLLKDEFVVIDGRLTLAGRRDPSPIGGAGDRRRSELANVLAGADPALPVLVLDHNPQGVDAYGTGVDLVFSGHTHKGQIFPANLITDLMYSVDYGYYRTAGGTQVIVTSGVGTWGLPMRVGTNCEIVQVHLKF